MKKNNAKIFFLSWCNRQGCCRCCMCSVHQHTSVGRLIQYFSFSKHFFFVYVFFCFYFSCRGSGSAFKVAPYENIRLCDVFQCDPIIFALLQLCVQFICAAASRTCPLYSNYSFGGSIAVPCIKWSFVHALKLIASLSFANFLLNHARRCQIL